MAGKERNIEDIIKGVLKTHRVEPTPDAVKSVKNVLYVELKYKISPQELEKEVKTGEIGAATLTADKIVSDMIRNHTLQVSKKEEMKSSVDRLFMEYKSAKGVDKVIADTLVMMGVKPTKENIKELRSKVHVRLKNEVSPKEIEEEIRTGRPGKIAYAVMDFVKEHKPFFEKLSPEERESLSREKQRLKESLKKPRLLNPNFSEQRKKLKKRGR